MLAVLAWYFVARPLGNESATTQENSGVLLLSLKHIDSNNVPIAPYTYSLDLDQLGAMPLDIHDSATNPGLTMHYDVSPNENWATFVRISDSNDEVHNSVVEIYRADVSQGNSAEETDAAIRQAVPISMSDGVSSFPVIANDGGVLYMQKNSTESSGSVTPAHDWVVQYTPAGSKVSRVVGEGIHPQWIDDRQFVYLKDDGLYVSSVTGDSERKIIPSEDLVMTDQTIASTPDGWLAWSNPNKTLVREWHVTDWNAEAQSLWGVIPIQAFYPVFSPSGDALALLVGLTEENTGIPAVSIGIYDTQNLTLRGTPIVLENYQTSHASLSDWVQQ